MPEDALALRAHWAPGDAGVWSRDGRMDGRDGESKEAGGAARACERDGRADGRGHRGVRM